MPKGVFVTCPIQSRARLQAPKLNRLSGGLSGTSESMDQLTALLSEYRSAFANGLIEPATLSRFGVMILAVVFSPRFLGHIFAAQSSRLAGLCRRPALPGSRNGKHRAFHGNAVAPASGRVLRPVSGALPQDESPQNGAGLISTRLGSCRREPCGL
jgi:hypothetical protein